MFLGSEVAISKFEMLLKYKISYHLHVSFSPCVVITATGQPFEGGFSSYTQKIEIPTKFDTRSPLVPILLYLSHQRQFDF
jgi:hypothetical protein